MSEADRRARAEARRRRIVIRKTSLGEESDVALDGTREERVALAVELTRAAWALTGRAWPEPRRWRSTVRFVARERT